MPDEKWYNEFFTVLEYNKNLISYHDIRFYNISRLPLIAGKINDYSNGCNTCNDYKKELLDLAVNIDKYINDSKANRKKFEQKISIIKKHLISSHNIRTNNYYTYFFSLLGILTGLISGIIFYWILPPDIKLNIILPLTVFFLIAGRSFGYLKDKRKYKKKEQI